MLPEATRADMEREGGLPRLAQRARRTDAGRHGVGHAGVPSIITVAR